MSGLKQVARVYDPEEAQVAISYLSAYGIVAFLNDNYLLSVNPALRIALGGHKILVPAQEESQALQLLGDVGKGLSPDDRPCPRCGAQDYVRVKALPVPLTIIGLFFGTAPMVPSTNRLKCRQCNMIKIDD